VRVLVLETTARDDHTSFNQSLDHRLVGIPLFTLVIDDALASEPRRSLGQCAIFIDSVRNCGVDAFSSNLSTLGGPDFEIIPAMSWRRVNKPRASIISHVLSIEHRHSKRVSI